jgi:CheY-like chemotaxis protein
VSRVLLVDDDPQINAVVKTTLEMLGHTVMTLENPEGIAEIVDRFQPQVTLVDYALPGCSGIDVLKNLVNGPAASTCFLATGMVDVQLLKTAVEAGASSMLCKPYRMMDLAELISLAELLEQACSGEAVPSTQVAGSILRLQVSPGSSDLSTAVSQIVSFARGCGGDADVYGRRLPLVAYELIKNASVHGVSAAGAAVAVELRDREFDFELWVIDSGPGFDWKKTLARAKNGMEKSRASGLQLVMTLAQHVDFADGGRAACAILNKASKH